MPIAARVKKEAGIPTRTVGLIVKPEHAEDIVAKGQADMVSMARCFLDDPHWGWHAAKALGAEVARPPQYQRAGPETVGTSGRKSIRRGLGVAVSSRVRDRESDSSTTFRVN